MAAIAAADGVEADGEDINEHANAITHHVDFGGRRVRPANRNFDRGQSVAASEEEEFGVEAETLDGLEFEDDAAAFFLSLNDSFQAFERSASNSNAASNAQIGVGFQTATAG